MIVNPAIYYALIGAFAGVSLIAIYLLIMHSMHHKKTPEASKADPNQATPAINTTGYDETVRAGQIEYQGIIAAANKRAQDIIQLATKVKEDSDSVLNNAVKELIDKQKQELSKDAETLLSSHKSEVDKLGTENINMLNNISKDFQKYSDEQLGEFKKAIMQQTLDAQNKAQERIQEEYKKIEGEIVTYKQDLYKRMDDHIYTVIFQVTKMVIGRSLDLTTQEKLIGEALERAKKDVRV